MKYCLQLVTIFLLASSVFAEYQVTPEDISEAKQIRKMGKRMGLDKPIGDKLFGVLRAANGGKLNKKLSTEEKAALLCVYEKSQKLQFDSEIEVYARYNADNETKKATDQEINKECGLTGLVEKQK